MKAAKFQWNIIKPNDDLSSLENLLKKNQINQDLAPFFDEQGIESEEALQKFIKPTTEDLYDPFLMQDMEKAVNRIQLAVENGEEILVYGDYDADGITSTTVMKEAIELLGGNVHYYLPHRFHDGYGPNVRAFKEAIESGVSLIVTVDNGVAGHEALSFAKEQGVDVIVTDHHELPPELPEAYAIIHPRHPEGNYPFGDLAGVGVAFKVATALLGEPVSDFLDLVAIGTIADLVSLTDENRVLVQLGLQILKNTERLGLLALCQVAKISMKDLSEESIGFTLGPRLNALGRLGDAMPGVALMTTFDEEEAKALSEMLEEKNRERQSIVRQITEEALMMIKDSTASIYVLAKKGWHEGVLGIVASRITQETGKPALVFSISEDETTAKGSGRSVEAFNLYEALNQQRELFTHFGGHHMAAGMTLPVENLSLLETYLEEYVAEHKIDFSVGGAIDVQPRIPLEKITIDFVQQLKILAPFGTDNPKPRFLITGKVKDAKQIGGDQTHLKLTLTANETSIDIVGFNFGKDLIEFSSNEEISIVGEVSINEWNGNRKVQMQMLDYKVDGLQIFDLRGKKSINYPLPEENIDYLTFHNKSAEVIEFPKGITQMVVVDCPESPDTLKEIYQNSDAHRIYLQCQSKEEVYLSGMPTRNQFSALFRFIREYQDVDVRYKITSISDFLKIPKTLLIFMIQVFSDLNFVTIENGVMNVVKDAEKHSLEESSVYQKRLKEIESEKFLLYSNTQMIKNWLEQ